MPGNVLIADSVATNRIILNVLLNSAGHRVRQVATAQECLAELDRDQPDLLLLSASLQDQCALQMLSALRQKPALAQLPIFVFLSEKDGKDRMTFLNAGATDVLCWPIEKGLLMARLRAALRSHARGSDALMQDQMARALGFKEDPSGFIHATHPIVFSGDAARADALEQALKPLGKSTRFVADPAKFLGHCGQSAARAETAVLDFTKWADKEAALSLVADLRASEATRHFGILAIVPEGCSDRAASLLDSGANDVVTQDCTAAELCLKLRRLSASSRRACLRKKTIEAGVRAAITDPLTGLFNRRFALPELSRALSAPPRPGQSCAILVIDIDHFKTVNDRYGHLAGDAVLSSLSRLLNSGLRPNEIAARIGGEEFLVIMKDRTAEEAARFAEQLCQRVRAHGFETDTLDAPVSVTISIGLAVADPMGNRGQDSAAELLARADSALYSSKRAGRNQVTVSACSAAA